MATYSGGFDKSGYTLYLDVSESSVSIANNTSVVNWKLRIVSTKALVYGSWDLDGTPYSVTIDGSNVSSGSKSYDFRNYQSLTVASGSKTITHNSDGSRSVSCSASFGDSNTPIGDASASGTFVLSKIPRYATSNQSLKSKTETSITMNWSSDSTIDYIWYSKDNGSNWTGIDVTDGKSGSYTISNLLANTTYQIKTRVRRKDSQLTTDSSMLSVATYDYPNCTEAPNFTLGNSVELKFYNPLGRTFKFYIIGNGTQIDVEYSCSSTSYSGIDSKASSVPYLYATIPNAKSGQYKVKVVYNSVEKTKTGGTYTINSNECTPTVGSISYKDSKSTTVAITGNNQRIIRNNSNLLFTVGTATAKNSASISKYEVTIGGVTKSRTSVGDLDFGTINLAQNTNATLKVTDSRGISNTKQINVVIDNWELPTALIELKRKNNYYSETYFKVDGSCSYLNGKNELNIKYQYKKISDENYSELIDIEDNKQITIDLDNNYQWNVKAIIKDKLGTATYNVILERGMPIMFFDRKKTSVGINCFPSKNNGFEVNGLDMTNTYSTTEQKIGIWINGKPIYKKTITGTIAIGTNVVDTTINSYQNVLVKVEGKTKANDFYQYSIPWYENSNDFINFSLAPEGFRIHAGSNNDGRFYEITVYYTKTTD